MREIKVDKTLDVRGMRCPYPLLKTTREVASMMTGETLLVITDDPMAPDNIDSWAEKEGHRVLDVNKVGRDIRIYLLKMSIGGE
jgi:TusA-related sulfurtransferase